MPPSQFEIRQCLACHLRYPLTDGHPFGTRCPVCMGETRRVLRRALNAEPPDQAAGRPAVSPAHRLAVLLDNIRSAWNVGSILRSADGFGFAHAYLCGICPTPDHEAVAKTALGAEDSVSWSHHKDAVQLVSGLKREGWQVWALEATASAEPIQAARLAAQPGPLVLMLGSEVTGVDPGLLALADRVFHIPMRGEKRSFNVAMAFSIAAYQLRG